MAAPDYENTETYNFSEPFKLLSQILVKQKEAIHELNYIANELSVSTEQQQDTKSSHQKVAAITALQKERFEQIDAIINENIFAIKKGKTAKDTTLVFGKEVRKIEAGIRTIKLFLCDVLDIVDTGNHADRLKDRLDYYHKRASHLEGELYMLQTKATL
jgi:hypothetical protein